MKFQSAVDSANTEPEGLPEPKLQVIPPRLKALLAFAKSHTPAPFLRFLRSYKPPQATDEIVTQLRALHRLRVSDSNARHHLQHLDESIGRRLAADKLHATEIVELKLHPPNEDSLARFNSDARLIAGSIQSANDTENASSLGLAFAIWFQTELSYGDRDPQRTQQEVYDQIHRVFRHLHDQNLLENQFAIALCQAAWTANPHRPSHPYTSILFDCLRLPGFVSRLLQATTDIGSVQVVLEFANFLLRAEDGCGDFEALSFLDKLPHCDERKEIVQRLAAMQFQSAEPVRTLSPIFKAFRFPAGLSAETAQAWMKSPSGSDLLGNIARLSDPCRKTRIPYLSPDAQRLSYHAESTLQKSSDSHSSDLSPEEYMKRWRIFLGGIAGIQISRDSVQNRFVAIVSSESRLRALLRHRQRPKLIQFITGDGNDRDNWVLAKLIEAAGAISPEDYSMCSICLGSVYLHDTEGRFCNRKTFRDFADFIDRDIRNLRAFIDPTIAKQAEGANVGHIQRLMSFIRDFLIDPQNAHYTNFEVYRTKPFGH